MGTSKSTTILPLSIYKLQFNSKQEADSGICTEIDTERNGILFSENNLLTRTVGYGEYYQGVQLYKEARIKICHLTGDGYGDDKVYSGLLSLVQQPNTENYTYEFCILFYPTQQIFKNVIRKLLNQNLICNCWLCWEIHIYLRTRQGFSGYIFN